MKDPFERLIRLSRVVATEATLSSVYKWSQMERELHHSASSIRHLVCGGRLDNDVPALQDHERYKAIRDLDQYKATLYAAREAVWSTICLKPTELQKARCNYVEDCDFTQPLLYKDGENRS